MTTQKENPQAGQALGAKQGNENGADYAAKTPSVSGVIMRLKQQGHTVTRSRTGGFNVWQGQLMRHCFDADSLREFARYVGVKS